MYITLFRVMSKITTVVMTYIGVVVVPHDQGLEGITGVKGESKGRYLRQ